MRRKEKQMYKKITSILLLLCMCVTLSGCFTINHKVGNGAQGSTKVEQRQWYVLWGLVPLNEVDSQAMAAGANDYTVTTQHTFLDMVIGIFTGLITVQPKTVAVTK